VRCKLRDLRVGPHRLMSNPISSIVMLDATALADAIRTREISCVEVMEAFLDHIAVLNPKVNAIVCLRESGDLLAEAHERDAQILRGEYLGPLHGFPFAAKELVAVKGLPHTMGSPILKDVIAPADSIMAERIRNAGAIFIGKTNSPEFGLGSHTFNPVYGLTRNAFDPSRTAGGSSGGAAVALALRMLPLADGSDYGGSLRNPAGWNNVFGFRTSFGLIPSDKPEVWLPSMGVLGPMARSVPDLALLLSVQAGHDPRVPLSMDGDPSRFLGPLARDFKNTRIAWLSNFGGQIPYEREVLDVCRVALSHFETLGCTVEEAYPNYPIEKIWEALVQLRAWQSGSTLLAHYTNPRKRELLKPEALFEVEKGLALSAFDVSAASAIRSEWYQTVRQFLERYDFMAAPTAQLFPFDAALDWPHEIAGHRMTTYHEWMKGMLPITMAGLPALAVPAGFNDRGLPIGIQIVGPNRADFACLQMAHAYDQSAQWTRNCLPKLLQAG
jgi:amidase